MPVALSIARFTGTDVICWGRAAKRALAGVTPGQPGLPPCEPQLTCSNAARQPAVRKFSGGPAVVVDEAVAGSAGQGFFVDVGGPAFGPICDVVDLAPAGPYRAVKLGFDILHRRATWIKSSGG